ncbi:hypothetical protein J2125_003941 [Erwinia toletana]|uniref:DUF2857 domain-containing protein n=1 Tax=Winslowiella toletana TaxID=92490 RepID=A0ABS4PDN0_9GAMM|nr:DUF2857 domain-containing protein [Winslowiella toletana]MBP2170749.1 hypothetical protein [Winslowiella toletana]
MIPSINQAVLTQVLQELKEGNVRYCESMGFDQYELAHLSSLSVEEVLYLSNSAAHFLKISVNHDVLRQMLVQVHQTQQQQKLVDQSLALGASIALLHHYFGMSTVEVSARRRLLGICVRAGRNENPDEAAEHQVWHRWQEIKPDKLDSLEGLQAMLCVAEELSLSLTVVWNLVQQWEVPISQEEKE